MHQRIDRLVQRAAALKAQVEALQEENRKPREQNHRLRAQVEQDSTSCSKPPSADPPGINTNIPETLCRLIRLGQPIQHIYVHKLIAVLVRVAVGYQVGQLACRVRRFLSWRGLGRHRPPLAVTTGRNKTRTARHRRQA